VKTALEASFGIDLRSLFLLRLAIALMIWVDLGIRAQTMTAHYTDAGVLPRAVQRAVFLDPHPGRFSFHMMSGGLAWQALLFALIAVAALLLALGYRTRLSLLTVWLLTISLHSRNDMILTGGDQLLRMTLFWALWLPLGGLLSLDARAGRVPLPSRPQVLSSASFAFVMQLCCVYWFSVAHKTDPQWRNDFTAVHYALHIDSYATPFGAWLRQFPRVTRALTAQVFYLELVGPFLVFGVGLLACLPRLSGWLRFQPVVRTLTVFTFMGLHAGLGLGLALGTFSWFAMAIWVALLPSEFWDWLERQRARSGGRFQVLGKLCAPRWARTAEATPPWTRRARRLAELAAACALALVLGVNLRALPGSKLGPYLDGRAWGGALDLNYVVHLLRLDQHWGLFAPKPRNVDGWFVLRGVQASGAEVDLLRPDARLSWRAPALGSSEFPSFRWRKYYRDLRRENAQNTQQRPAYLSYWCRTWNAEHAGRARVDAVELVFMKRRTLLEGGHTRAERVTLARGRCSELSAL